MKASVKFREEKCPLLKTKFPFKAGPLPFTSGLSVGSSEDLGIHIGTLFSAGPSFRLAFRPNSVSSLALILKAGLGFWGSPKEASVSLSAEFPLNSNGFEPMIFVRLKPRAGDFSISKNLNFQSKTLPSSVKQSYITVANGDPSKQCANKKLDHQNGVSMIMQESSLNGIAKEAAPGNANQVVLDGSSHGSSSPKGNPSALLDSEQLPQIVTCNIKLLPKSETCSIELVPKIETCSMEQEMKAREENSQQSLVEYNKPPETIFRRRDLPSAKISLSSIQQHICGAQIKAHSVLPLSNSSQLCVRWGIKIPLQDSDFRLPSLVVDKISYEPSSLTDLKTAQHTDAVSNQGRNALLPGLVEESRELTQVAGLCDSMKQQLYLLYGENRMLKQAMEDMRKEVSFKKTQAGDDVAEDDLNAFWNISSNKIG